MTHVERASWKGSALRMEWEVDRHDRQYTGLHVDGA